MNEANSAENEGSRNSDNWKSWTPKEMISTFLHESRTPLTIIKGYVEILSNEEAREHHPQALKSISAAIGRLEDLWQDMADYLGELMRKS